MNKRPSVLLVANWDSGVGYAWWLMESYWAALAKHYSATHDIIMAYPSISTLPDVIAQAPLEAVPFDFRATALPGTLRQLRFLRSRRVRCVYFSDRRSIDWRYLLFRIAGVRAILTHDHSPGRRSRAAGAKVLLKRLGHRIPFCSVDALIAATEFVHRRHLEVSCAPPSRCFVAPNGLPERPPAAALDLVDTFGIPANRLVMVTTGRANRYKGIDFAIRVMAHIVTERRRQDIHYLFCGDGPDLQEFNALAHQLKVENHVTFAGRRDDIREILRACDFAIHPSHGEVGYSLSILEYMEAGLAVVVPDNDSVCEATEHDHSGLVYPDGDTQKAAESIIRLLADAGLRERLGRQAVADITERYSLRLAHRRLIEAAERTYPAEQPTQD
ncbi:MAG: D-inositol-3-phosphate glycosyltransferase [Pseudomonadales bacterium]|nr:D-inositol-3-phosphate glycosyltransferase [Pseudomonadales bacterium]